jgi:hypothetical protein
MKDKAEKRSLLEFLNQTPEERTEEILNIVNSIYQQVDQSKGADDISLKILEIFQTQYPFPNSIKELIDIKNSINDISTDQNLGVGQGAYYTTMVMNVLNTPLKEQIQQQDLDASKAFHPYLLKNTHQINTLSSLQVVAQTTDALTKALNTDKPIDKDLEPLLLLDSNAVSIVQEAQDWLQKYEAYVNTTLGLKYRAERKEMLTEFNTILSDEHTNHLIKLHQLNQVLTKPNIAQLLQKDSIGATFSEIAFKIKQFLHLKSDVPKHMALKTQLQELKQTNPLLTKEESDPNKEPDHQHRSSFDVF